MNISEKLRTIGLGAIHEVLDKVRDLNKPGEVKVYIADLERSIGIVDDGVKKAIASINIDTAAKVKKAERVAQLTKVIEHVLGDDDPSNDAAGHAKIKERRQVQADIEKLAGNIAKSAERRGVLEEALVAMRADLEEMRARLQTLESKKTEKVATEEADNALKLANRVLSRKPGSAVDSALTKAELESEAADIGLKRTMEEFRDRRGKSDEDVDIEAEAAEIRARLAAQKAAPAAKKAAAAGGKRR